jgi:hypothetical protein
MGNGAAPAGVEPNSTLAMAATSEGPAWQQVPIAKKRNKRKIKMFLLGEGTEKPLRIVADASKTKRRRQTKRNQIAFMLAERISRRNCFPPKRLLHQRCRLARLPERGPCR